MKLTVLGSGTALPTGVRGPSGYWLDVAGCRLRLDAGPGTLQTIARLGLPWSEVTHFFISHFHLDHVLELPFYLFSLKYSCIPPRTAPLTLIGPVGLRALLENVETIFDQKLLEQRFAIEIVELLPGDTYCLAEGALLSVEKSNHRDESLAVKVTHAGRALAYTGDTGPSELLGHFFAGVDLLVCECSFVEEGHGTKHLSADEAAQLAERAAIATLLATHFYFDPEAAGLAARLAKTFSGRICLAHDGLTLDV